MSTRHHGGVMQRTIERIFPAAVRHARAAAAAVLVALLTLPSFAEEAVGPETEPSPAEAAAPETEPAPAEAAAPETEPAPGEAAAPEPAAPPAEAAAKAPTAQQSFATAQEGADALIGALDSTEDGALVEIFGPEVARFQPTDQAAARIERKQLADAAREALVLREDGPDEVTLVIGANAWPFPIPLVETDGQWSFDTAAGLDELVNRLVGAHELAAIELGRAYVLAQAEYASADRDGDQVLEYAQRFESTTGTQDGLYWPAEVGQDESPLGPFAAAAGEHAQGRTAGDPYRGYYFKVLKRQGAGVPGGAYDYVINGNMIGGFALVAWPADYGSSGVMTFVVNQLGQIYEKDLGKGTAQAAAAMTSYAPDESWSAASE